jgi:hypothetical protein
MNECSLPPAHVWHRTRLLGRKRWITVGRAGGRRTRVFTDTTFAGVMVLGRYVEFGWK